MPSRTEVIYYGIQFPDVPSTQTFASDSSRRLTFAYVGRFVQEKGVAVCYTPRPCFKRSKAVFVLLIGDGEQRAELDDMCDARNLSDTVRMTGFLNGDQP